jgi:hypothetical protein
VWCAVREAEWCYGVWCAVREAEWCNGVVFV